MGSTKSIALSLTAAFLLVFSSSAFFAEAVESGHGFVDDAEEEEEENLFAGGSGTEDDPYLIENVHQLQNMTENMSAHYELIDDIDASETEEWNGGRGFEPVGEDFDNLFSGIFDGENHKIMDLHIDRPNSNHQGLFGAIGENGTIQNVGLVDIYVNGSLRVGGLAGASRWRGMISNSYVTGNLRGNSLRIGGIVGINWESNVSDSYTAVEVVGDENVGGAYRN